MTRAEVIDMLREHGRVQDCSYSTVRYGSIPSYHGYAIDGDDLIQGIPSTGTADTLRRVGEVRRRPLSDVDTWELARIADQMGLLPYAAYVALARAT